MPPLPPGPKPATPIDDLVVIGIPVPIQDVRASCASRNLLQLPTGLVPLPALDESEQGLLGHPEAPGKFEPPSQTHPRHCGIAHHRVGSHAEPPTLECAIPTGKSPRSRAAYAGDADPSPGASSLDHEAKTVPGVEPVVHQSQLRSDIGARTRREDGAEAAPSGVKIGVAHYDRSRRRSRARPGNMRNGLCN
jgi:hypothetical protein